MSQTYDISSRYFGSLYNEEGKPDLPYIFDREDGGAEVCGPFNSIEDAEREAGMLNENDAIPDGTRPHQLQHALERTKA